MRPFACGACHRPVFFENTQCLACDATLAWSPQARAMVSVPADDPRLCPHRHDAAGCNWLVDDGHPSGQCAACRLVRTVPDLSVPAQAQAWGQIAQALRRLVYGCHRLGLDLQPKSHLDDPDGLAFEFLARQGDTPVVTGHAEGLITLDIAEADDVHREAARTAFDEPLRTVLQHLRHELGHYVHHRWVAPSLAASAAFRTRFGDERADYGSALARHHQDGPPADWPERHISGYASAHPHEDWAETCAHLWLILDSLETAASWGLQLDSRVATAQPDAEVPPPARLREVLLGEWLPLAQCLNAMHRSFGLRDDYPFLLNDTVVDKLTLAYELLQPAGWCGARPSAPELGDTAALPQPESGPPASAGDAVPAPAAPVAQPA